MTSIMHSWPSTATQAHVYFFPYVTYASAHLSMLTTEMEGLRSQPPEAHIFAQIVWKKRDRPLYPKQENVRSMTQMSLLGLTQPSARAAHDSSGRAADLRAAKCQAAPSNDAAPLGALEAEIGKPRSERL